MVRRIGVPLRPRHMRSAMLRQAIRELGTSARAARTVVYAMRAGKRLDAILWDIRASLCKDRSRAGHGGFVRTVEDLFRTHAADVLAYALRRTDAASADDVVSEVFMVAARRLDRIPDDESQLWLYGVARRVLANRRRAARRRAALASALGDLHRGRVHDQQSVGRSLFDALAALRSRDREVLMLTAWEGLTVEEVAVVMGCSPQAVHTRLHRARARLQAEIASCGDITAPIGHPEVSS